MRVKATGAGATAPQRGITRTSGFSLLEVLIALIILSIGLLGLAGLQATSLQNNRDAAQASQANFLAQDMIDRIRANAGAARDGDYDITFTQTPEVEEQGDNWSVAKRDVNDWLSLVQNTIPSTTGSNCGPGQSASCGASVTVANDDTITVSIRWNSNSRNGGGDTRFNTESQL